MQTETAEVLRDLLANNLAKATRHVLATFAAVPDDKLDYKPSDTAKSARENLAHLIGGNAHVGSLLGAEMPPVPEDKSRGSLVAAFEGGTTALLEIVRSMPPERFDESVDFFGRPRSIPTFLLIIEWHLSRHAAQIDYLQTIWGDLEDHM